MQKLRLWIYFSLALALSVFQFFAVTAADTDVNCNWDALQVAVEAANATIADDVINIVYSEAQCDISVQDTLDVAPKSTGGTLTINANGAILNAGQVRQHFELLSGVDLTLNDIILMDGYVTGTSGGAITITGGTLTLNNTTFESNNVDPLGTGDDDREYGGAIYAEDSTLTVRDSYFYLNNDRNDILGSNVYGGAIALVNSFAEINTTYFNENRAGQGGAIYVEGSASFGDVVITRSTFANNYTFGGAVLWINAFATLDTNTFYNNYDPGPNQFDITVELSGSEMDIKNSTFYGDVASAPAIKATIGTINIENSIIIGQSGCATDTNGNLDSRGHNLVGYNNNPNNCPNNNTGDEVFDSTNINQVIEITLGDFGGPTPTLPLDPDSDNPAIDSGRCPDQTQDQRGLLRPAGAACDKGAVEYQSPGLTLDAGTLNFDTVQIGSGGAVQAVEVFNTTGSPVMIDSLAVTEDTTNFSVLSGEPDDCTVGTLADATSCLVRVEFDPQSAGNKIGTLSIVSDAQTITNTVTLLGTGGIILFEVRPNVFDFGEVVIGNTSPVTIIEVRNLGSAPLEIERITMAEGADEFDIVTPVADSSDCTVGTLETDTICNIRVTFTPLDGGDRDGRLRVVTNATDGAIEGVTLEGIGLLPELTINPMALNFDDQQVGTQSDVQVAKITNSGSQPIQINSISVDATGANDFSLQQGEIADCTTGELGGGGAVCNVRMIFSPTARGARTGTLIITSNLPTSPHEIPLNGTGTGPELTLSATTLDFGRQLLNTRSAPQVVTVTNTGDAPLLIDRFAFAGQPFGFALLQPETTEGDCGIPFALDPSQSCKINVVFEPPNTGERQATLRIESDAPSDPDDVTLIGEGVTSGLDLSNGLLAFGDLPVGDTSTVQTVTVENVGDAAAALQSITLTGANPGQFTRLTDGANDCAVGTLASSTTCTVRVRFQPTSVGAKTAIVRITSDTDTSPDDITLSGTGTQTGIMVTPGTLTFADRFIGTTSTAQTVTVTNTGTTTVTLNAITINSGDAHFTIINDAGDCTTGALTGGVSCSVRVAFAPSSSGALNGNLRITSDAPSSPDDVSLSGTGIGQEPAVTLDPVTLAFGDQAVNDTSPAQAVTVTNSGNAPLNFSDIRIPNGQFQIASGGDACTTSAPVEAGNSCTVYVVFAPTTAGNKTESLRLESNAPGSPHTVALTGRGVRVELTVSPSTLDFDDQLVNTTSTAQTVTVTNTGTSAVDITGVTLTGGVFGEAGSANVCTASTQLNAGQSCVVRVTFTPTSTGDKTGELRVESDAPGSPDTVALSGTGVEQVTIDDQPFALTVLNELDITPAIPVIRWTHRTDPADTTVPGEWYGVYMQSAAGTEVLFEWFPAAGQDGICTGTTCTVDLTPFVPGYGLLADEYQWWVGAYLPDGSQVWSGGDTFAPATFTVSIPPAMLPGNIAAESEVGRPVISFDDDPNTLWVQLYLGGNGQEHVQWYGRDDASVPFTCADGRCVIAPALDWPGGTYIVWMQAWGPGGLSDGGSVPAAPSWIEGPNLVLPTTPPTPPTDLSVTGADSPNPTFTWPASANASWYEFVIEPASGAWLYPGWHAADDLGCVPTCTWQDPALAGGVLPTGDYIIRVRAYGPGGLGAYSDDVTFTYSG